MYLIGRLENGSTFGIVEDRFHGSFYIRQSAVNLALPVLNKYSFKALPTAKTAMDGGALWRLSHPDPHRLRKLSDKLSDAKVRTYEADVKLESQFLMSHGLRSLCEINGASVPGKGVDLVYKNPTLRPAECNINLKTVVIELFFDNETLSTFALSSLPQEDGSAEILVEQHNDDEALLLQKLKDAIKHINPDIISGWGIQQDIFLPLKGRFKAHNLPFDLGRHRPGKWFIERGFRGIEYCILQGRQLLDIEQLMDHTWERYSESTPECILNEVLAEEVPVQSPENCGPRSLLLGRLLRRKNLVELSYSRSLLTGLTLERCWGSIASFEYLYIMELHKQSFVAPSLGVDRELRGGSPGGLVLEPHAGIHRNIFVFDFKSLYPSIIRTFNIDPLAYSRGRQQEEDNTEKLIHLPNGVMMDRQKGILPATLERFFDSRQTAKDAGDELGSFIYKILMNSFFGVLGTSGCRFAQGPLVSSVSQSGHYLMRWTRSLLEEEGFKVLYGDTDSLFVDLAVRKELSYDDAIRRGEEMQNHLNKQLQLHIKEKFGLECFLDLEFEKFYRHFFQPSMRADGSRGRAKSYAAMKATNNGDELEIVGLEAVRRDWTDFARETQRHLLKMIFAGEPGQAIEEWIQKKITHLKAGELDEQLVYRKSLSKPLDSYTSTTPPHVKAARLLEKVPRVIFYMMTTAGPQPQQKCHDALDYQHYINKQLTPIVRSLSQHYDFNWEKAVLNQQTLF